MTEFASFVASLDPGEAAILVALCVAAAAWGAFRAWRALHVARMVEDMPTARAGSAHQGYVELEGRARLMDGPPIVAPLSREPCVWFRYVIEERLQGWSGQNHKGWKVTERGASDDLFWLDDSIEIFLDTDNDKSGTYGEKDYQYHFAWDKIGRASCRERV